MSCASQFAARCEFIDLKNHVYVKVSYISLIRQFQNSSEMNENDSTKVINRWLSNPEVRIEPKKYGPHLQITQRWWVWGVNEKFISHSKIWRTGLKLFVIKLIYHNSFFLKILRSFYEWQEPSIIVYMDRPINNHRPNIWKNSITVKRKFHNQLSVIYRGKIPQQLLKNSTNSQRLFTWGNSIIVTKE